MHIAIVEKTGEMRLCRYSELYRPRMLQAVSVDVIGPSRQKAGLSGEAAHEAGGGYALDHLAMT